jgi:hypothetical protein
MAKRRDVIADELRTLADDVESLWRAATRDPDKEARRERVWMLLSGALAAAATMASRRAVAKLWPILTGEEPLMGPRPVRPAAGMPEREAQARAAESDRTPV